MTLWLVVQLMSVKKQLEIRFRGMLITFTFVPILHIIWCNLATIQCVGGFYFFWVSLTTYEALWVISPLHSVGLIRCESFIYGQIKCHVPSYNWLKFLWQMILNFKQKRAQLALFLARWRNSKIEVECLLFWVGEIARNHLKFS